MDERTHWNDVYGRAGAATPAPDPWLTRHRSVLEAARGLPVIDLGCGAGANCGTLLDLGLEVIACDLSRVALETVAARYPGVRTVELDMADGLPFADVSVAAVVADLSLHYFSWRTTLQIVADIERVLRPSGAFLFRVNSVDDVNYGAGQGRELEPHYYDQGRRRKRFFTETEARAMVAGWEVPAVESCCTARYGLPKHVVEVACRKRERG